VSDGVQSLNLGGSTCCKWLALRFGRQCDLDVASHSNLNGRNGRNASRHSPRARRQDLRARPENSSAGSSMSNSKNGFHGWQYLLMRCEYAIPLNDFGI
jgi:hypothetical protein